MDDSDNEYESLELPTVVESLKNILRQYPDNGQIIKELVQNAEDARASEVEIVYHTNTYNCDEANKLFKHFLQGPAMSVYNNAIFTDEDWKGIRRISESVKKQDSLKIGRFGLGFKSVFHMTDYITVISGSKVMFIDPTRDVERMCCSCKLQKLQRYFPIEHCSTIFGPHLSSRHIQDGHFHGTFFWFPLRQMKSLISDTIYTDDKMDGLFSSFATEISVVLTFLKSLEKISLETLHNGARKMVCNVAINPETISEVNKERQRFIDELQKGQELAEKIICKYRMTLDVQIYDQRLSEQLLVLHYLQNCDEFTKVQPPSHIPLVGIASSLSNNTSFAGRLFCFLPLPFEEEMNTSGLPWHINGFFVLDQNRRHIRWKTAESVNEPDVLWNEALLKSNVAEALFLLLNEIQERVKKGEIHSSFWYSSLPYINKLHSRWRALAEAVWQKLLRLPFIYSEVLHSFLTLDTAILTNSLTNWPNETCETVVELLQNSQKPVASIPVEMLETLEFLDQRITCVTPQMVRQVLRKHQQTLPSKSNQMCLLRYVLSDGNIGDLLDVPLLPLESGSWIRFRSKLEKSKVFLCLRSEAEVLLFNEEKFVAVDMVTEVKDCLTRVAEQGNYQVINFRSDTHAAALLEHTLKNIGMQKWNEAQTESWLTNVWQLLENVPLASVTHLPLLPTQKNCSLSSLVPLTQPVVLQTSDHPLPDALIAALNLLGVEVIPTLPAYVERHHELFNYLNRSTVDGIIRSLKQTINGGRNEATLAVAFNQGANEDVRKALLNYLLNNVNINGLDKTVKNCLCKLNLFSVFGQRGSSAKWTCVHACPNVVPPGVRFPFPLPFEMIQEPSDSLTEMARSLGAKLYSEEELCCVLLDQNPVESRVMDDLLWHIFTSSHLHGSFKLVTKLTNLLFVLTLTGKRKKARDLFDPEDKYACVLDALQTEVPDARYSEHLGFLRRLGLRSISSITAEELVRVAKFLDGVGDVKSRHIDIANVFMDVLEGSPHCAKVCRDIEKLKCIPSVHCRPDNYPASLAWFAGQALSSPCNVKSHSMFSYTLGTVISVVECDRFSKLSRAFKWEVTPSVALFVRHFENVISAYDSRDAYYITVLSTVYNQLTFLLEGHGEELQYLKRLACVLTDRGFQEPDTVYINRGPDDVNVAPFGAPLLPFLQENEALFEFLGCHSEQTTTFLLKVLKKVSEVRTIVANQTEKYLELSINILKKLANQLEELDTSQLLIPIESEFGSLSFAPVGQCSFSAEAFEWLAGCEEELGVQIVHHAVSQELAAALRVPSLNDHLFAAEEPIMPWEQQEPLTTRIRNLLDGYRDGVAVLKEMVQNADDAGAKTVRFLYDKRKNENAKTKLFSAKMQECQGPALWAYNDATFSDADLFNITQVGSASKMQDCTKIGKFGLGFCSVYNLTDTPSFISGLTYVLFDPHRKYLEERQKTGGVKFDLSNKRNRFMMQKLIGQFQPFHGIFSCDIQSFNAYPATLFRLPLRTPLQASDSKISNIYYGPSQMEELLSMFMDMAGNMVIFSQSVENIEIYRLEEDSDPMNAKLVFQVRRSHTDPFGSISLDRTLQSQAPTLVSNVVTESKKKFSKSILTNIEINSCNERSSALWLVSWCTGPETVVTGDKRKKQLLSLGAVAVPLQKTAHAYEPIDLDKLPKGFYKEGHFHCFFPLPVKTSLPVHINGFFDVAQDRTSLKMPNEDERSWTADSWNSSLMQSAVCSAYHHLLETLSTIGLSDKCEYYRLWPVTNGTMTPLECQLKTSFYDYILTNSNTCKVFRDTSVTRWLSMANCIFMDNQLLAVNDTGGVALKFLKAALAKTGTYVVALPDAYSAEFRQNGLFTERIVRETEFFTSYFLPKVSENYVTDDERNLLIARALDICTEPMKSVLQKTSCIPIDPSGRLKMPKDLIDPKGYSSILFRSEDEVFPVQLLRTEQRLAVLRKLGMHSNLTESVLVDRAKSVEGLRCWACALDRSEKLLEYLSQRVLNVPSDLNNIAFLPVMPKPQDWPIAWAGDNLPIMLLEPCSLLGHGKAKSPRLAAPMQMCIKALADILGSQFCVFSDRFQHSILLKLSMIVQNKDVPVDSVIAHLEALSSVSPSDAVKDKCHKVYEYLDRNNTKALQRLQGKKVLLTSCGFKEPKYFAGSEEAQCPPYLFSTIAEGYQRYPGLTKSLGIVRNFEPKFVLDILQERGEELKGQELSDEEIELFSKLLKLVFFEIAATKEQPSEYPLTELLLPDSTGRLHPAKDLCIEDDVCSDLSAKFRTVHPKILMTPSWYKSMGILTKTKKNLQQNSRRFCVSFGQKEPLTTRLRNILQDYPKDVGIMKELLQNAEDAHATEVKLIKDFRRLPSRKLFDPLWAPLQGPAVCVYNDSCFTEEDLNSIQLLGDSRKAVDPDSIGKYGIGFNAVYHLTDAPSFLTRGPDVPHGEVLCMFDPHCKYDPNATPEWPGVQFHNLEELRKRHPDSFLGYLEDSVMKDRTGTLFRLPLRTLDAGSKISTKSVSTDEAKRLIDDFVREMLKCMQFLRHVQKVSVVTVSNQGKVTIDYEVTSNRDSEARTSVIDITNCYLSHFSKNDFEAVFEAKAKQVTSYLDIYDSKGDHQKWLVVEQFGGCTKPPESVIRAFKSQQLLLRPFGAVAIPIEGKLRSAGRSVCTTSCYLPLPVSSGLPFSVNGHFALDSCRRGLWVGEDHRGIHSPGMDQKTVWNNWLLQDVVAPVASRAILEFRKWKFPNDTTVMSVKEYEMSIAEYYGMLPNCEQAKSELWKQLIRIVLRFCIEAEFPVWDQFVVNADFNDEQQREPQGTLSWCSLINKASDSSFPVCFWSSTVTKDSSGHYQKLDKAFGAIDREPEILKRLGMKIGHGLAAELLCKAGIDIRYVTPEVVVEFLQSWKSNLPDKCRLCPESPLEQTPFRSSKEVRTILKYVSSAKGLFAGSGEIPLLLTQDDVLRCFDSGSPVFLSKFQFLVPTCKEEFVHQDMYCCTRDAVAKQKQLAKGNKDVSFQYVEVTRPFTIRDLADRIASVVVGSCLTQDMNKISAEFQSWLINFWTFVHDSLHEMYDEQSRWTFGKQELINCLGEYTLYPVHFKGDTYVMKIKHANRAMLVTEKEMAPFRKLSIPVPITFNVDNRGIPLSVTVPSVQLNLATSLADKAGVLSILYEHRESIAEMLLEQSRTYSIPRFSTMDAELIMEYFGQAIKGTLLSKEYLRALPFYLNINGELQSIDYSPVFILWDEKIPREGLTDCEISKMAIILKKPVSHYVCNLYKYLLNVLEESDLIIYSDFILPNFNLVPQNHHKTHLEYLKNTLPRHSGGLYYEKVLTMLKNVPFIPWNGTLKCAKWFHDPRNEVFKTFSEMCLPKEWAIPEWREFLKSIGLVTEVTSDLFEQFAQSLDPQDTDVEEKSEILTQHLFTKYDKMGVAPNYFSHLKFIVPCERPDLNAVFSQFVPDGGLTSLREAVLNQYADVVWSTAALLPYYADPGLQNRTKFGIQQAPQDDIIVAHIRNIIKATPSPLKSDWDWEILDRIYKFLSVRKSLHDPLCREPIVYLPGHCRFVRANMVVFNLGEDIVPYLYNLPIRFGKFVELFKALGAMDKLSCDCLASILYELKCKCSDAVLNPEESRVMKAVMKRLVQNPKDLQNLSRDLFLPTTTQKLEKSSTLYIADNQQFLSVIQEKGETIPCMIPFQRLDIEMDVHKFVKCLPESARPRYVTDVAQEDFCWSEDDLAESSLPDQIHTHLNSPHFINGLLRLIKHAIGNNGSLKDEHKDYVLSKISSVEAKQVKSEFLSVDLLLEGKCIGNLKRSYFIKHDDGKCLLILSRKCDEKMITKALCKILLQIFKHFKWEFSWEIMFILQDIINITASAFHIQSCLDQNSVRGDINTDHDFLFNTELGSYVEHQFLYLLDCEFCQFDKQELVAMKKYIEDPDDDTFIIVQVLEKVTSGQNVMFDVYKVYNGDEKFDVEAHKLYKFLRNKRRPQGEEKLKTAGKPIEVVPTNTSVPDGEVKEKSLQSILKEVKAQVKKIYETETDPQKRRHLLRRLFLLWHPDKSPDKRATKVFQYMQHLICKCEKGQSISDDDEEDDDVGTGFRKPPSSDFDDFSYYWNFRSHYTHKPSGNARSSSGHGFGTAYSNSYSYGSFFSRYKSKPSKVPDKKEGRRWATQARHDLETARSASSYGQSPCWMIQMCYQAVEKLMKAVLFMEDRAKAYGFCHGWQGHNLNVIAFSLNRPEVSHLVENILHRVSDYNHIRYPSADGDIPCSRFNSSDSEYVLQNTELIFDCLSSSL